MPTRFKETEIGLIPEDWRLKKVRDITDNVCVGFVGSCLKFYCDKSEGLPMIRTTNLTENGISYDNLKYVLPEFHQQNKKSQLKIGDLVIARHGNNGQICIFDGEFEANCLNIVVIKPNNNLSYNKYLLYSFKSPLIRHQIEASIVGSVQGVLNTKTIEKLEIPYPALYEQHKIVDILEKLDQKININNQMNQTLEAIGQAIFRHWFVHFEFPDENGQPYKSSGGEMVDSELGEIPAGWDVGTLGNIVDNFDKKRIPLSKKEREMHKGKYPYYGATSIMDYVDDYIFDGVYVLMAEDGSVIDDEERPVLQYVWGQFWVNNHAHILKGKKGVSDEYIYLLLKQANIKHLVTGAVQLKINQKNMNSLNTIIPDFHTVSKFSTIIKPVFAKYRVNADENEVLSQIRDSLLPKLMSGKIRVPMGASND